MVLLWVRACKRAYAPGGAGYEGVQSHFEQRQHDEVEAREAKRRRVGSPSA